MYFCNHCRLTKVGKDGEYCDVCKKKATLPTIVPPDTLTASILSTPSFSRSTLENGRLGTYSNNYVNGIVKNISHDVFKGGIGEHILHAAINGERFSLSRVVTVVQISIDRESSCQLIAYGRTSSFGEISVGNKIEASGYFTRKNQFITNRLTDTTTGVTYHYYSQTTSIAKLLLLVFIILSIFLGVMMHITFGNILVSVATVAVVLVLLLFSSDRK
ncbi:TPA: hypothetical protein ACGO9X_001900 [Streptococcus suis]